MKTTNSNTSFVLNSAHQSFAEKQKNLFAQLDNAEKCNKRSVPTEEFMDTTPEADHVKPQRSHTKHYKRKESIFKRPEAPISRCLPVGRMPSFSKQPKKWTKYSLADVSDDDISDRGNTKAALSFLKELEQRKGGDGDEKLDELPEKIVFKKAAIIHKKEETNEPEEDKASFRSSKLVMPEYVVGQKVKKERKNKEIKMKGAANQLKLDHLLEEEDD